MVHSLNPVWIQTGGGVIESNNFLASVHGTQFESSLDSNRGWGKILYTVCWCWQNIGFNYPPPVWIQIYIHRHTDLQYGDCTKCALHWASSCHALKNTVCSNWICSIWQWNSIKSEVWLWLLDLTPKFLSRFIFWQKFSQEKDTLESNNPQTRCVVSQNWKYFWAINLVIFLISWNIYPGSFGIVSNVMTPLPEKKHSNSSATVFPPPLISHFASWIHICLEKSRLWISSVVALGNQWGWICVGTEIKSWYILYPIAFIKSFLSLRKRETIFVGSPENTPVFGQKNSQAEHSFFSTWAEKEIVSAKFSIWWGG